MMMGFAKLRIRFNDRNTVDVAQLRAAMENFLARVTALFVNRKACHIHCYTHAASWLFKRKRFHVSIVHTALFLKHDSHQRFHVSIVLIVNQGFAMAEERNGGEDQT